MCNVTVPIAPIAQSKEATAREAPLDIPHPTYPTQPTPLSLPHSAYPISILDGILDGMPHLGHGMPRLEHAMPLVHEHDISPLIYQGHTLTSLYMLDEVGHLRSAPRCPYVEP